MGKVYVPFELPQAGGAGYRPKTIPDLPGFGAPPQKYERAENAPSDRVKFPSWFQYDPQVHIGSNVAEIKSETITGGTAGRKESARIKMECDRPGVNGFVVTDNASYVIRDSEITLNGDGPDDFGGFGAGVRVLKNGTVTMENTKIETTGVIRPCTFAGDYSTLVVRNCELIANGGTLDPEYDGQAMREPPAGLGLGGNCRTHLSVGDSHCYFYDTKIVADGWAALSTDACYGDMFIEANRCDIQVRNVGYASYCDHGGNVYLNDCRMEATIGAIIGGKCREFLKGCNVKADRYGAMLHSVYGNTHEVSELSVSDCDMETEQECILVKSQNAYLDIRNSTLKSGSGVLLHTVYNEDFFATELGEYEEAYGVKAVLSDMVLEGDILHEDPQRVLAVALKHVKLRGRIENTVIITDPATTWTATADSHVSITAYGPMGTIDAEPGVTIYAKSDVLKPGETVLPSGGKLIVEQGKKFSF